MRICSGFGKKKLLKFPSGSEHAVVHVTAKYKVNGKEAAGRWRGAGEPVVMAAMTRNSLVGSYDILIGVWQLGVLRFGKDNF